MTAKMYWCLVGVMIIASCPFGTIDLTHSAEVPQQHIELSLGSLSVYKTDRPFSTIKIGDPKIIDVDATSNRTLILNPLVSGITNVLFLDDRGDVITNLDVMVSESGRNRVKIFLRGTINYYRCAPTNCEIFDQIISKEAAPPPPDNPSKTPSATAVDLGGRPTNETATPKQ